MMNGILTELNTTELWKLTPDSLPYFSTPAEVLGWVTQFGLEFHRNGHDPNTFMHIAKPDGGIDNILALQIRPGDWNLAGYGGRRPDCLMDISQPLTVREGIFIHILNILHKNMGWGGGPVTTPIPYYRQAHIVASWMDWDLCKEFDNQLDQLSWPKAWAKTYTDALLNQLITLNREYIHSRLLGLIPSEQGTITATITQLRSFSINHLPTWATQEPLI